MLLATRQIVVTWAFHSSEYKTEGKLNHERQNKTYLLGIHLHNIFRLIFTMG